MPDVKYKADDLSGISIEQLRDLEGIFKIEVEEQQSKLSTAQSNLAKIRKELKNRKRNGR